MRPLSLTIQSFGPFRDKQDISFESFPELFLITGKTGSGKTTIFDAIMFALYGRLSGTRDPKSMVSDFTDENAAPSVELVFSAGGGHYKILRQPPLQKKSADGRESKGAVPAAASLFKKSGSSWTPVPGKLTEINDYVENLLRLTADEFSKIVLLPQGEFQKFLVADTKEKTKLLEKLFPTKTHEELGRIIKDRYRDRRKEADMTVEERDRLMKEFDPASFESTFSGLTAELAAGETLLSRKREEIARTGEDLARAREKESDFIELEKNILLMKGLTEKESEITRLEQRALIAREALEIVPLINSRDDILKEINTLKNKISESGTFIDKEKAELAALVKKESEIPGLEREIAARTEEMGRINALIPRAKTLAQKKIQVKAFEETSAGAAAEMAALRKKLETCVSANAEIRKAIGRDEKKLLDYEETVRGLADVSRRCAELSSAAQKSAEAVKAQQVISLSMQEKQECEQRLARLRDEESVLARQGDESAAGRLALQLKKGEPCPVCGSTEHPLPAPVKTAAEENGRAAALSSAISETEKKIAGLAERSANHAASLEALRAEIASLTAGGSESLDEMTRKKNLLDEKKKSLESARINLLENRKKSAAIENETAGISAEIEKLDKKISSGTVARDTLRNEINSLSEECGDAETLSSAADRLKGEAAAIKEKIDLIKKQKNAKELSIEGAARTLDSFRDSLAALEDKHARLEKDISVKSKACGFASPDDARSGYLDKKDIVALENTVREFGQEKKSTEKAVEILSKKIGGTKRPDIEGLEKKYSGLLAEIAVLEKKNTDDRIALRDLQARKDRHDALTAAIDRLLRESETLSALSNDLNGKNPKNLTFQNFILGAYLEEVARYASLRLHTMSEERYTLMLNEEISHGNREAGLDLDVFDAYTGQKRSVKSLSGGEKFMASIALALGLADVIQSRAGGVELDAIFIDEGFGSLDDSALDKALGILDDIREDRMVGIISHVNELKNRIPSRIHVVKGANGSHIEMQ